MSLKDELERYTAEGHKKMAPKVVETLIDGVKRLKASGIENRAVREGATAPDIALPNAAGETVKVADLLRDGPVVVSFYRGGWCPYCNLELKALQDRLPEIEDLGAKLVAITPETPDKSLSAKEKNDLSFEVLSDQGNAVARAFGLVFRVNDEVNTLYREFGIDLEATNGDESHELPIPATFVIDRDGTIIKAYVDADYTKRLEPGEIVKSLRAAEGR